MYFFNTIFIIYSSVFEKSLYTRVLTHVQNCWFRITMGLKINACMSYSVFVGWHLKILRWEKLIKSEYDVRGTFL